MLLWTFSYMSFAAQIGEVCVSVNYGINLRVEMLVSKISIYLPTYLPTYITKFSR